MTGKTFEIGRIVVSWILVDVVHMMTGRNGPVDALPNLDVQRLSAGADMSSMRTKVIAV